MERLQRRDAADFCDRLCIDGCERFVRLGALFLERSPTSSMEPKVGIRRRASPRLRGPGLAPLRHAGRPRSSLRPRHKTSPE